MNGGRNGQMEIEGVDGQKTARGLGKEGRQARRQAGRHNIMDKCGVDGERNRCWGKGKGNGRDRSRDNTERGEHRDDGRVDADKKNILVPIQITGKQSMSDNKGIE